MQPAVKGVNMRSPAEVIQNIRKIRFAIGLDNDKLSADIAEHIEEQSQFRKNATRLVEEIHTNKTNFILELIQNAEDNNYTAGNEPFLRLLLYNRLITVQNNETGFTEQNVGAICNIGDTTKGDKTYGYIGEKGIGFKSVFKVSSFPQVYSNGYQFGFNYKPVDPESIIIPEWVDKIPEQVDTDLTNIVLPVGDDLEDLNILDSLEPALLLFLKKLRRIEIINHQNNERMTFTRKDSEDYVKLESSDGDEHWKVVKSKNLTVLEEIEEQRREGIKQTELALAFPLHGDLTPDIERTRKLFAFLPVRDYGFKFIIQGDFILDVGRLEILETKDWNNWLISCIPDLFIEAVDVFKSSDRLKYTYYNYIPLSDDINHDYFKEIVTEIHNKIRNSQCVLSESSNWLSPFTGFTICRKNLIIAFLTLGGINCQFKLPSLSFFLVPSS